MPSYKLPTSPSTCSIGVSILAVALALASQITIWITLKAPQRREISFSGRPSIKETVQEP